jgi:putative endonuclease
MRTEAQRSGDAAESFVEARLTAAGWTILARRLRVGRAEIDLLATDPGPPRRLVAVEVRWRRRPDHGRPEETVDRRKLGLLRGAIAALVDAGRLPDGATLPRWPPAIDLVTVEPGPRLHHLRDVSLD